MIEGKQLETQGEKTSAVDLYDDILDRHMHNLFGLVELEKKRGDTFHFMS